MQDLYITEQVKRLHDMLRDKGVNSICEYSDGHKHVDLAILDAQIYIEVDGLYHYTNPDQIERDFKRTRHSDDDNFDTIHIPNIIIKDHCLEFANAIKDLVNKRFKSNLVKT